MYVLITVATTSFLPLAPPLQQLGQSVISGHKQFAFVVEMAQVYDCPVLIARLDVTEPPDTG
jgi:hypothetical protein